MLKVNIRLSAKYDPKINIIWITYFLIYSTHLPWVTVGVGVTIESLEEEKKIVVRSVLLVKEFRVLDSVAT